MRWFLDTDERLTILFWSLIDYRSPSHPQSLQLFRRLWLSLLPQPHLHPLSLNTLCPTEAVLRYYKLLKTLLSFKSRSRRWASLGFSLSSRSLTNQFLFHFSLLANCRKLPTTRSRRSLNLPSAKSTLERVTVNAREWNLHQRLKPARKLIMVSSRILTIFSVSVKMGNSRLRWDWSTCSTADGCPRIFFWPWFPVSHLLSTLHLILLACSCRYWKWRSY